MFRALFANTNVDMNHAYCVISVDLHFIFRISRFTFQNVLKKHPHVEECIPIGLKQGVKQVLFF